MEVIIRPTSEEATDVAAHLVANYLNGFENLVMGLATGSTPEKLYAKLIEMHQSGAISFANCTTFNLDEYVGLPPDHNQSYHYYMRRKLFDHVDTSDENIHIPDGMAESLREECKSYEKAIKKAGGIRIQLLGLGENGHIGFNEPFGSLASRTWIKILSRNTMEANARFFENKDDIPHHVLTMGIGTIMKAKHCVVLAVGEKKAQAVFDMIEGPVAARCPASALQMHRRTTVILDEAAASRLQHRFDYQWVEQNKLQWQRYEYARRRRAV